MKMNSGIFVRYGHPPSELHVRREARGWTITADDRAKPLSLHWTADDAIALANALARHGARVVVHCEEASLRAASGT